MFTTLEYFISKNILQFWICRFNQLLKKLMLLNGLTQLKIKFLAQIYIGLHIFNHMHRIHFICSVVTFTDDLFTTALIGNTETDTVLSVPRTGRGWVVSVVVWGGGQVCPNWWWGSWLLPRVGYNYPTTVIVSALSTQ